VNKILMMILLYYVDMTEEVETKLMMRSSVINEQRICLRWQRSGVMLGKLS
jgi:hypothetical protein